MQPTMPILDTPVRRRVGRPLQAAGTHDSVVAPRIAPPLARRLRLIAEIGTFFVLAPIALPTIVYTLHIPLFVVLQPVLIAFVIFMARDKTFSLRRELYRGLDKADGRSILILFAVIGPAIAAATYLVFPELFLSLPRQRPGIWLIVMAFYPILSVLTQELVYRTFFFHRYGPLFGEATWLAILVNGVLFGFAHIIFHNLIAVLGTIVMGMVFAWRYARTRSFWAVWIEHSLYGGLVFTIGLGQFFFTGIGTIR